MFSAIACSPWYGQFGLKHKRASKSTKTDDANNFLAEIRSPTVLRLIISPAFPATLEIRGRKISRIHNRVPHCGKKAFHASCHL